MDYAEVLHIPQCTQKLNCKSANESILEALVVVHFNELIKVNTVQFKDATQMVSENEIVTKFDDSFNIIWITFSQKQQQFCLHSRLIIIFLLVFDKFNSD